MTPPCLFYSTFPLLSTLLTMVSCWSDCESPFGVDNLALDWFRSYLACRRQHVCCGGKCSALVDIICGVPQGSVLGPILFIIYTADLESIVAEHGLSLHQYADDSQIYGSCRADATSSLSTSVSQCVDNISSWMQSNRLQIRQRSCSARPLASCHNSQVVRSLSPAQLFLLSIPFRI